MNEGVDYSEGFNSRNLINIEGINSGTATAAETGFVSPTSQLS